jgi:hypothetical protein
MEPESGTAADVVRVNGILQACTVGHGIRMSTSAYLSRHARCVTTHILCGKVRSKRVIFVVFSPKNFVPLPGSVTRTVGGILANLTAASPLSAGTASHLASALCGQHRCIAGRWGLWRGDAHSRCVGGRSASCEDAVGAWVVYEVQAIAKDEETSTLDCRSRVRQHPELA